MKNACNIHAHALLMLRNLDLHEMTAGDVQQMLVPVLHHFVPLSCLVCDTTGGRGGASCSPHDPPGFMSPQSGKLLSGWLILYQGWVSGAEGGWVGLSGFGFLSGFDFGKSTGTPPQGGRSVSSVGWLGGLVGCRAWQTANVVEAHCDTWGCCHCRLFCFTLLLWPQTNVNAGRSSGIIPTLTLIDVR